LQRAQTIKSGAKTCMYDALVTIKKWLDNDNDEI